MRRFPRAIPIATLVIAACGGHGSAGDPDPRGSAAIASPLEVYQDLGMLAGPDDFAAVARFATLAGPADSTYLLLSMSLPNSAVRFQRDQNGFAAQYHVNAVVLRDSARVAQIDRSETIRVGSFAETNRTEESVVFQDMTALAPGHYLVRLQVKDENSSRGFRAVDTIDVPAYPRDARLGTPLLVYEGSGRDSSAQRPRVVINPRNTVGYGGETPHVYIELYGAQQPEPVTVRITDEAGALLWNTRTTLTEGTTQVRHVLLDVPTASLPIGRLWLEAAAPGAAQPLRTPLLITISDQWMVANFSEVLQFLEYIATTAEIDSLKNATGIVRRERWDAFWAKRDPLAATPVNEFREQFFERVRIAADQFVEGGRAGWATDRGQGYIVLGPPDNTIERRIGREVGGNPNFAEWLYESVPGGRLVLQFFDRTGFGRFELTQSSQAAFRSVAMRLRPRN